ncbi:hypothetical protein DFW37_17890 [Clostridioides difficile]|nr:hypothetical protein [Clostridioides difficile]EGT4669066.1 hypothetical protein [Clostridioides difficile]
MKCTNTLRKKINGLELNLEGEKIEDVLEIFIETLYKGIECENYKIRPIIPEDENFKEFISLNQSLIYKYANNIKKDYDFKFLDPENEYSNIYLYIVESLHLFFRKHCNEDVELFKYYIEDSNKTYVKNNDVEYTFSEFMHMSVERMIKEENKLHEKSIEKGNTRESGRYARIDLDATAENEEDEEIEINFYKMGLYTSLHDEDKRSYEDILQDNIREMKRIQDKLSTVLTKSQVEFITTETYGCYYDFNINDFIMKTYTRQQRNQFLNQISKRE